MKIIKHPFTYDPFMSITKVGPFVKLKFMSTRKGDPFEDEALIVAEYVSAWGKNSEHAGKRLKKKLARRRA